MSCFVSVRLEIFFKLKEIKYLKSIYIITKQIKVKRKNEILIFLYLLICNTNFKRLHYINYKFEISFNIFLVYK